MSFTWSILNPGNLKIAYLQKRYEDIEDHLQSKHLLKHRHQVLKLRRFPFQVEKKVIKIGEQESKMQITLCL